MKLTVGKKILGGYGIALAALLIVGGVSYQNTVALIDNSSRVAHTHHVLLALENLISQLANAETGMRGYLLTSRDAYLAPYNLGVKAAPEKLAELRQLTADNPRHQAALERLRPLVEEKLAVMQSTIDLRKDKGAEAALEFVLSDRGQNTMVEIRKIVAEIVSVEQGLLEQRNVAANARGEVTKATILYGSAAGMVFVIVCSILIQRSITAPLGRFVEFVNRVGTGDLTSQTKVTSGDEVGALGEVINDMVTGLKVMTSQIQSVTENVNSAAAQISSSTRQQVGSTKEQAATVQEITSTMQEISQSGAQIVAKAKEVAIAAEEASSASKAGMEAVQNTNRTMEAIRAQVEEVAENIVALSEKTQAVGEIIATVNEIAEQSNLLALNATIEAADAGQDGARFAVVASEMKNLADQAKGCTVHVRKILGEIQKAINTSVMLTEEAVKRVESGKQQADVSEDVIRQMSMTTDESIQAFQQIIGATNQQQVGFQQVALGMQSIDQATQQTATGTAQLEQAVISLSALSRQLQTAVGGYRV